jgi:phage shock protein A
MMSILKTLAVGASARNEAKLRNHYALDLIDQKIRETETGLKNAKTTLASQIQRSRAETRNLAGLDKRIADVTERGRKAFEAEQSSLAHEAAQAIADMENERGLRRTTLDRLNKQIERLRLQIEKSQRGLIDLKQRAMMARSVRTEQQANVAIAGSLPGAPAREARELIDEVLDKDSSTELDEIFEELEDGISHTTIEERLGQAGIGGKSQISADDVLARFTSKPAP